MGDRPRHRAAVRRVPVRAGRRPGRGRGRAGRRPGARVRRRRVLPAGGAQRRRAHRQAGRGAGRAAVRRRPGHRGPAARGRRPGPGRHPQRPARPAPPARPRPVASAAAGPGSVRRHNRQALAGNPRPRRPERRRAVRPAARLRDPGGARAPGRDPPRCPGGGGADRLPGRPQDRRAGHCAQVGRRRGAARPRRPRRGRCRLRRPGRPPGPAGPGVPDRPARHRTGAGRRPRRRPRSAPGHQRRRGLDRDFGRTGRVARPGHPFRRGGGPGPAPAGPGPGRNPRPAPGRPRCDRRRDHRLVPPGLRPR